MRESCTIVALSTPPGRGALSVLRLSGSAVISALKSMCDRGDFILKNPRVQVYTALRTSNGLVIDYALATYFPAPHSFTGEDVCELSLHGSPVILREALRELYELGLKPAEAGEFTKRAFLNGKMDLAQAEAVSDLISAETEAQARIAREQLEGKLSTAMMTLGEPLRDILAEIEAFIDFPDEDISPATVEQWRKIIEVTLDQIKRFILSFSNGRVLREGASVAIAGIPNVGKSSLLNRLLGEERAIVTEIAGTTRDSIEESLELDGVLIRIWDTAGIVDEADSEENSRAIELPEQMGIKRSWKLIERADLVLFLFDAGSSFSLQKKLYEELRSSNTSFLVLGSKKDIHPDLENNIRGALGDLDKQMFPVLNISSTTGEGIEELKQEIVARVCGENQRGDLLISSERHYLALKEAYSFLENAQRAINEKHPAEYISFEIRQALLALQEIVGVTNTEDILGRIFSKFCIGK